GTLVLKIDTAANYPINSIVRLHYGASSPTEVRVIGNRDGHLKLDSTLDRPHGDKITIETLVAISSSGGQLLIPEVFGLNIFYLDDGGIVRSETGTLVDVDGNAVDASSGSGDFASTFAFSLATDVNLGVQFGVISDIVGQAYAPVASSKSENALVVKDPPEVIPGLVKPKRVASFAGKPPKGLSIGDLMVMRARDGSIVRGLRVAGVQVGSDDYALQFETAIAASNSTFEPDAHEFHGPMTESLRPIEWDRNPEPAFSGAALFPDPIDAAALELIRPGRVCLIEDEREIEAPVLATVREVVRTPAQQRKVIFTAADGLGGFEKGWTTVNFNAVKAGHGETKSPKTLGSGDGERPRQNFRFAAREVSFIPSTVAETGVAPDMDVAVDGVLWPYRDLIDPTAEGTESFSSELNEDDSLTLHFRRRLPTGTDNVLVRRHRSGVGAGGVVPARAFTKPMKKSRFVSAVTQPFASTGGAEREPVDDIRVNAPARLAANDRAVSLEDFARIARRRSDIWQAHAALLTSPTASHDVCLTVVPANGGAVGETQKTDLIDFIEARSLPGLRVAISDYGDVGLLLGTKIYVDTERYDKTEVQEAAHAILVSTFALERRGLGQPVYIAEVIAAL
ncbi:MAG: hypothetical protein AAF501_20600, partial [Pseudomonadota bacterium]